MHQRRCLAKLGGTLNTISRFAGQAAHRQNTPGKGASMLARICTGCGLLLALVGAALAQSYPAKPLTMIIPFAAGGPTHVLGRVMAQRMSEIPGQRAVGAM